ncbi:hypothetical protein ACL1GO_09260 [Corynebacterium striatum]
MIDGTTYPETRYQLRGLPVPTTTNRHISARGKVLIDVAGSQAEAAKPQQ